MQHKRKVDQSQQQQCQIMPYQQIVVQCPPYYKYTPMAQNSQFQDFRKSLVSSLQTFLAKQSQCDNTLEQQLVANLQTLTAHFQLAHNAAQELEAANHDLNLVCTFLDNRELELQRMMGPTQTQNHL